MSRQRLKCSPYGLTRLFSMRHRANQLIIILLSTNEYTTAKAFPNRNYVEINISNISSNYLTSTMEGLIDNGEDWKEQGGVKLFYLYINESLFGTYLFYNSYGLQAIANVQLFVSELHIIVTNPERYMIQGNIFRTPFSMLCCLTQKYTNTIAFLRLRPSVS